MTVLLCLGILMSIDRQNRQTQPLVELLTKGFASPAPMLTAPLPTQGGASSAPPSRGDGRIAQLVEQLTLNQRVLGSSPSASTTFSMT